MSFENSSKEELINIIRLSLDPMYIKNIENQTKIICHYALVYSKYSNVYVYLFCKDMSDEDCLIYLKKNINYRSRDEDIQKIYDNLNNKSTEIINFIITELRRDVDLKNICALQLTIEQQKKTLYVSNGNAIKYYDQTKELCDYAVEHSDGRCIQFIKNPTKEQINKAIASYEERRLINVEYEIIQEKCEDSYAEIKSNEYYLKKFEDPFMEQLKKDCV
jgi:hypothetical protein